MTSVAKKQAQSLTTVVSASSAVRVASVASFDPRGYWEAYLEDPPGSPAGRASLTDGPLLAAYYRPLVAAQAGAGDSQITEENGMTMAQLPGIDLVLAIPAAIVTIVRPLPLDGQVSADQLRAVDQITCPPRSKKHTNTRGGYREDTQIRAGDN